MKRDWVYGLFLAILLLGVVLIYVIQVLLYE